MSRTTFFQRDSTGAPATGISHSATSRYDNDTAGPSVTVTEVSASNAPGFYYFDVSPTGSLLVLLDAGSGVTDDAFRYQAFNIQQDSTLVTLGNVADAVWDEALAGHSTAGSAGKALTDVPADTADAVWDEALAGHSMTGTAGKTLADVPAASATADAVWDEALSGHTTSGTAGKALADSATATAAAIADAVWDEASTDHVGAGSFGRMLSVMQSLEGFNRRVISTTYVDNRPTSQTMAVYANSTDATADTNRLSTITITRAFDSVGRPTTSLQVGS